MTISGKTTVLAYRVGGRLARLLPERSVVAVSQVLGRVAARLMGTQRKMLRRHIRRVLGPEASEREVDTVTRKAFGSYVRYYLESFRLPSKTPQELADGVTIEGAEPIYEALDAGHGVVAALPHLGGWEWIAFWLTQVKQYRLTAVVEALEPPELFEWFKDYRESLGMNVVPLGPNAGKAVAAALARGDMVVLVSDRDIQGNGAEVSFLGEKTTLPMGPAILAMRSKSPLFVLAAYFDDDRGHFVKVLPEISTERKGKLRQDATRLTQLVADDLASLISEAPEQWHLLQPNWPSDATLDPRSSS